MRFGLTDLNVRRLYTKMNLQQTGTSNESAVDLTNLFYIGPNVSASFGIASEVMLPWKQDLAKELTLTIDIVPQALPPRQNIPTWYGPVNPIQDYINAISYATF